MDLLPLVLTIALALLFSYTNGFHDAANAVATSISTRALTPRIAVGLAAVANLIGAFFGSRVTETVSVGIVDAGHVGLRLVAAALIGAIFWNFLTWWFGLPTSSSQALIGGLVGAALVCATTVQWDLVIQRVLVPMIVSPMAGLVLGWLLMMLILRIFRHRSPGEVSRGFRYAQTLSATAMAFGHGMQDAAKVAGVVVLALMASGHHTPGDDIAPLWVIVTSAVVMSLGTYAGGWRIMRTLGRRIAPPHTPAGFRGRDRGGDHARDRHGLPRTDLDHPRDHGRNRRGGLDPGRAPGALVGRARHRARVGGDPPGCRRSRRPRRGGVGAARLSA